MHEKEHSSPGTTKAERHPHPIAFSHPLSFFPLLTLYFLPSLLFFISLLLFLSLSLFPGLTLSFHPSPHCTPSPFLPTRQHLSLSRNPSLFIFSHIPYTWYGKTYHQVRIINKTYLGYILCLSGLIWIFCLIGWMKGETGKNERMSLSWLCCYNPWAQT